MRFAVGCLVLLIAVCASIGTAFASSTPQEFCSDSPPESFEECVANVEEDEREEAEEAREKRLEEKRANREQRELERHQREWAHKPTVTLNIARYEAKRRLDEAGFDNGWVECRGGRIDRTHWSCKVNLFYQGLRSRMRIWGAGYRNHRAYYGTEAGRFHSRLR